MEIPYSYAMELRDTGKYGFMLPPDQIAISGEEVWAFHQVMADRVIQEFYEAKQDDGSGSTSTMLKPLNVIILLAIAFLVRNE